MISSVIFYFYAIVKVIDVNKEKKRTKNWALKNSNQDFLNFGVALT